MRKLSFALLIGCSLILLVNRSQVVAQDIPDKAQDFTRASEFDYGSWTLQSLVAKAIQFSSAIPHYLTDTQKHDLVIAYIDTVKELDSISAQIRQIYADPAQKDPEKAAAALLEKQKDLQQKRVAQGPLAEGMLQEQVSSVVGGLGLTFLGQPLPAVLFDVTPLPMALIVSPRDKIQQDANISLQPDITMDQIDAIENKVSGSLDVSSLVVPVGGIGMYPTMVMSSSDLPWLIETVSHEWIHNYLTLRPLGMNYETSPELRTMNETTASIAGKEIADAVIGRYYPELIPPPSPQDAENSSPSSTQDAKPQFDFNREMHTTRVVVDGLLARGLIDRAEQYMDHQREYFWKNGYQLRKLNQAYFAFYGAYADQPGGAAGEDPVGPAVRKLREESGNLADFLRRIAGMSSYSQLEKAVN
jgi:hypothetical protein